MKPYIILGGIYALSAVISAVVSLNFFVLVHAAIEIYFFVASYSLYYTFSSDTASNNLQQVVYANPSAHGYARAYEPDYDDAEGGYQQSEFGNYDMQQPGQQQQGHDQYGEPNQQQHQYYNSQQ